MPTKSSTAKKVAMGLGLAALAAGAAAAAATYYFKGPKGKQHQKHAKAWAKKAKVEMVAKIKKMEKVSKTAYDEASREILAKYKQVKNIQPHELQALGKELQNHWSKIAKDVAKLGTKKTAEKKRA